MRGDESTKNDSLLRFDVLRVVWEVGWMYVQQWIFVFRREQRLLLLFSCFVLVYVARASRLVV